MRVSKLLGFLFLAILIGICLSLAPVSAGEHPWNDDQVSDTLKIFESSIDSEEPEDPEDPGDPENPGEGDLLGSPIFFLHMLVDESMVVDGKGNPKPDGKTLDSY